MNIEVINILKKTPAYVAVVNSEREREIDARQEHLIAIKQLDVQAEKAFRSGEKLIAESIARYNSAIAQLKIATDDHNKILHGINADRIARETARRNHEVALIASDFPEIEKFRDECDDQIDATIKSAYASETVIKNQRTGKIEHVVESNNQKITARIHAIRISRNAALDLRMLADTGQIPMRLAALRETWIPLLNSREKEA